MLNLLISWFGCRSCRKRPTYNDINNTDLISESNHDILSQEMLYSLPHQSISLDIISQDILSQEMLDALPSMNISPYDLVILMPDLFNGTNN